MNIPMDLENLKDLFNIEFENDTTVPDFEDLLNLHNSVTRQIYIAGITEGIGTAVDTLIRFWNECDEQNEVAIEDREPIRIYIDSCGGSLCDAFTIIDAIQLSKTPVWTITTGAAYSGGFFILISGHKRFAYPHASFLYHEGSASNGGTANQFANFAAFYKKQLEQIKDLVIEKTAIDEDKYKEIQKDDFWLTSKEALELNVIDEIVEELI